MKRTEKAKPGKPQAPVVSNTISNCSVVGIEKASVEVICAAVQQIASACEENAKALQAAACALSGNMIHIDSIFRVG